MKASSSLQVWPVSMRLATLMAAAAIIAGCGGVGTGGTGGTRNPGNGNTATTSVSGKVADGLLANATVFLDKNGNYQPDRDEPTTATDQNGSYTLVVDSADMGRYPIVAVATRGITVDKGTGLTVPNSYLLSFPATAVTDMPDGNFISPISTQVAELMNTGKYATVQDAKDRLSTQMGLAPGTDILMDYVGTGNSLMQTAAQNMASLMGSQASLVFSGNGTESIDVNRYRAMIGTIYVYLPAITVTATQTNTVTASITSSVASISSGQPFRNMSASFR